MAKGKKTKTAGALSGAVGMAAIPASYGIYDWRILAGAAAVGAIGGWFGVELPAYVKTKFPQKVKK